MYLLRISSFYVSIYWQKQDMLESVPNLIYFFQNRIRSSEEWHRNSQFGVVHSQPFDPFAAVMNGLFANSIENARHQKILRETRLTETSMKLFFAIKSVQVQGTSNPSSRGSMVTKQIYISIIPFFGQKSVQIQKELTLFPRIDCIKPHFNDTFCVLQKTDLSRKE